MVVRRRSGSRYVFDYRLVATNCPTDLRSQEGYAAKHNVSEEDRMVVEEDAKAADPMQGLEGLDEAGPKLA